MHFHQPTHTYTSLNKLHLGDYNYYRVNPHKPILLVYRHPYICIVYLFQHILKSEGKKRNLWLSYLNIMVINC